MRIRSLAVEGDSYPVEKDDESTGVQDYGPIDPFPTAQKWRSLFVHCDFPDDAFE
jgi:hypothetical protein